MSTFKNFKAVFIPVTLISLLFFCASCGEAKRPSLSQKRVKAEIDLASLELVNSMGECKISSPENGRAILFPLLIPAPCYFHTDHDGNLRYLQEDGYLYFLAESSTPKAGTNDCITHLQSLRVKGGKVEVSRYKDRVASCPPFQWDAFLFRELFN